MTRIGIVGVGLLGTAVAQRLLDAGFEVCGYDTRPEQLDALRGRGLKLAASVRETAVGSDAIFIILPSLDTVERATRELIDRASRETVLIQMSTISPGLTRALGDAA